MKLLSEASIEEIRQELKKRKVAQDVIYMMTGINLQSTYLVMNRKNGELWTEDSSWDNDFMQAKVFKTIGSVRGFITKFAKQHGIDGLPLIMQIKFNTSNVTVIDDTERVKAVLSK